MDNLKKDFIRFSTLHSWYKHIPIEGRNFYIYQDIGEQPRNLLYPAIKDTKGIHWHFTSTDIPTKPYYKIRFGPFLEGITKSVYGDYVNSFHILLNKNIETFIDWISVYYPEWSHISLDEWKNKKDNDLILLKLYKKEHDLYWFKLYILLYYGSPTPHP
jgi:L-2-hydroxyglutarate oxidase LhgO